MQPNTIQELQAMVRDTTAPRVLPRGGGTKPALSTPRDGATSLDLSAITGVVEYEPGEFIFTAWAGTRIADVKMMLKQHGQYMPFDPLLVERGATLGGTVAAGASGPGRYRYGGVRDFLLGVRHVDSEGQLIRSGAKVVKNAAGFDIPKLMVGSLGQLGVLVELTFKVFPEPEAYSTLKLDCPELDAALQALYRLTASQLDLISLDLGPTPQGATLWVRIGGLANALPARLDRARSLIGGEVVNGADEETLWRKVRELEWVPSGWSLVKVPLTPGRIAALEQRLSGQPSLRRYSSGGQVGWVALPESPQVLDGWLTSEGLSGLAILGAPGHPRLGARRGEPLARRVKDALDPVKRFVEV